MGMGHGSWVTSTGQHTRGRTELTWEIWIRGQQAEQGAIL